MSRGMDFVRWTEREGSRVALDLVRVVVALMVVRHMMRFVRSWTHSGFYGDFFYLPYFDWLPQPDETAYLLLLGGGILAAFGLLVGYRPRFFALICFVTVTYHLFLNEIWYRHNRYFLILCLALLCLTPGQRWLANMRTHATGLLAKNFAWAEFLLKLQMSIIYLASASSKSLDRAWRSGDVLAHRRLEAVWEDVLPTGVTQWWQTSLASHIDGSLVALATEYFLAIALWVPKLRRFAIWVGIGFHGFIEISASVSAFSYLSIATYFVFARLNVQAKQVVLPRAWRGRPLVEWTIAALDWMHQMKIANSDTSTLHFIDRSGQAFRGIRAWVMLAANLPILFVFFYPIAAAVALVSRNEAARLTEVHVVTRPKIHVSWLLVLLTAYLGCLLELNANPTSTIEFDAGRFIDIPWFFSILCALTLVFGGSNAQGAAPTATDTFSRQAAPERIEE